MMAAGYSLARDIGALQPRAFDWARHSPHLLGEGKCRCESIAYAAKQRSLSDHTHSADSRPIFNNFSFVLKLEDGCSGGIDHGTTRACTPHSAAPRAFLSWLWAQGFRAILLLSGVIEHPRVSPSVSHPEVADLAGGTV